MFNIQWRTREEQKNKEQGILNDEGKGDGDEMDASPEIGWEASGADIYWEEV